MFGSVSSADNGAVVRIAGYAQPSRFVETTLESSTILMILGLDSNGLGPKSLRGIRLRDIAQLARHHGISYGDGM